LTIDDLESKKPSGYGIPASDYRKVLGGKLLSDSSAFDFLTPAHLFSAKLDEFASDD
jgi:N-acetylneuraminate synthase